MTIKPSSTENVPRIMGIIADAQKYLAELNIDQWQDGYPDEDKIRLDIQNEDSYIILNEKEEIMATTVFTTKTERAYQDLDGEWLTPKDNIYGVIHRLAVGNDYRSLGIAKYALNFFEVRLKEMEIDSMRIDTHRENKGMQNLIAKLGYIYCGVIILESGAERLAYEKVL